MSSPAEKKQPQIFEIVYGSIKSDVDEYPKNKRAHSQTVQIAAKPNETRRGEAIRVDFIHWPNGPNIWPIKTNCSGVWTTINFILEVYFVFFFLILLDTPTATTEACLNKATVLSTNLGQNKKKKIIINTRVANETQSINKLESL